MSPRRNDDPGPEELRELAIEDDIAARDEALAAADRQADDDDDGDGDLTPADRLELDQAELDELGLTLDDPHQPSDE